MDRAPPREKQITVAGLKAVAALFQRTPDKVERLFYTEALRYEAGDFCKLLAQRKRPYRLVDEEELAKIAGTALTGGIAAVLPNPALYDVPPAMALEWAKQGKPLVLLDGIGNPHNLGAIVRTAAFFGMPRLLISDHPQQALPSSAAWRVAEGGFSHVELYRVRKLPEFLTQINSAWTTVATVAQGGRNLSKIPREKPALILLGNEEQGLAQSVVATASDRLTLRGGGALQSLNVASTAAILIHAFAKR